MEKQKIDTATYHWQTVNIVLATTHEGFSERSGSSLHDGRFAPH